MLQSILKQLTNNDSKTTNERDSFLDHPANALNGV